MEVSALQVQVTVRPDRTNHQRFYVEYEIELNEPKNVVVKKNKKDTSQRLCEVMFVGDHAIFSVRVKKYADQMDVPCIRY